MDWIVHNWPFVAGVGGVFITVGINVQMLRYHGVRLDKHSFVLESVRNEAHEMNGTVAEIKGSLQGCQAVQQLMLAGRVMEEQE